MRERDINRLLFAVQPVWVFCFYQQTLKFLFLLPCQEKKNKNQKAGLCPSLCNKILRGMFSKYGTAGPLPTHKRFWLGLFNPLLVPLQTHSLPTHLEFRAKRLYVLSQLSQESRMSTCFSLWMLPNGQLP